MAFRFDMQNKTPQQQIIVAKRDAEDRRIREATAKKKTESKPLGIANSNILLLVIDKDTCPIQDNVIMKQQCSNCKHYNGFKIYNGHQCIRCSYK